MSLCMNYASHVCLSVCPHLLPVSTGDFILILSTLLPITPSPPAPPPTPTPTPTLPAAVPATAPTPILLSVVAIEGKGKG